MLHRLRNNRQRYFAACFYLHEVVKYNAKETSEMARQCEPWQIDDLAELGLRHREENPRFFDKLVR